jgi:hypothetical protein
MTTDQLKRLADLLGSNWWLEVLGDELTLVNAYMTSPDGEPDFDYYPNPLDNADLMVRLMVEYKITVAAQTTGRWMAWSLFGDEDDMVTCGTPQEALLECLLAKLEASDNG